MEKYLSRKYANILDAEDVEDLFENMIQIYGSIQKAAEKCGVARTTAYGWERANYVKSITKMKVLKASLEANLIATLKLLTNKSKDRNSDLLLTYLSSIYQKTINVDQTDFRRLLQQFLVARRNHCGLIRDTLQSEVMVMTQALIEKAIEFQISVPPDSIDMIESTQILEILPDIITDLFIEKADPIEIATRYRVPLEIPHVIKDSFEPIIPQPTRFGVQMPSEPQWLQWDQSQLTKPPRIHIPALKVSSANQPTISSIS